MYNSKHHGIHVVVCSHVMRPILNLVCTNFSRLTINLVSGSKSTKGYYGILYPIFSIYSCVRCFVRPQCWWTSFAIVVPAGFSSQRERKETYCSSPSQHSSQSIVEWISEGVWANALFYLRNQALEDRDGSALV